MTASTDTADLAWEVGVGVEIAFSETIGLTPALSYENTDGDDDVLAILDLDVWFSDSIFGLVGGFYAIDTEDIAAYGRLGFCF
jgi:hypothetical protein